MGNYAEIGQALIKEGCLTLATTFFEIANRIPFLISDHHRTICAKLDEVLHGRHPTNRVMFIIPPRHSKTELAVVAFTSIGFAINPQSEFMHLSSSESLITRNVTNIRKIMETSDYRAFFPDTRMDNNAKGSISTTAGGVMYAAPFMGQITGFGCGKLGADKFSGAMLIDDPMKAQDCYSEAIKSKINELWTSTFKSRLNDTMTPVIVTAQRLALDDFCGYLLEKEGSLDEGGEWDVVKFPAIIDEGMPTERALWEQRFPLEKLKQFQKADKFTFNTQYMQNPMPIEGLLYEHGFHEYETQPVSYSVIKKCQVDTADTGNNYFCAIFYDEHTNYFIGEDGKEKKGVTGMYVTDILFTQKNTDYTEPTMARMLKEQKTERVKYESNNGGRSQCKNTAEKTRILGNTKTVFVEFNQKLNKQQKILDNAPDAQNLIRFPKGWANKYPEFHQQLTNMRKDGRNAFDDASDVVSEMVIEASKRRISIFAEVMLNNR